MKISSRASACAAWGSWQNSWLDLSANSSIFLSVNDYGQWEIRRCRKPVFFTDVQTDLLHLI